MMQEMFPDSMEDTGEDSGVDSVSSVLEDADKSSFTTSSTSLNEKALDSEKTRQNTQRSFLHDFYGRSTRDTLRMMATGPSETCPFRKPCRNSTAPASVSLSDITHPPVELAKSSLTSSEPNILPTLISLLDSADVRLEGPDSVVFITREGMRASLRLRVSNGASTSGETMAEVTTASMRHRPERSSRNSLRRNHHANNRDSAPASTISKRNFHVSVSVPPKTVATLTSKFNAIIQENRKSTSAPDLDKIKPRFFKSKSTIGTISEKPELTVASSEQQTGGGGRELGLEQQQPEQPTLTLTRPNSAVEVSRHEILSKGGKAGKPDSEDNHVCNTSNGVYETMRSFVKQAIKKFDKDELRGSDHGRERVETGDPRIPNASFLWRLPNHLKIKRCGRRAERLPSIPHLQGQIGQENDYYLVSGGYEVIGASSSKFLAQQRNSFNDATPEGYDEVRRASSESGSSVRYDEIRAPSVAYDELKPPPLNGYIVSGNSSVGYERVGSDGDESTLRYEDCGLAKAVPAVVNENQLDSISYFYDDIGNGMGNYSGSHHSYEAINLQNCTAAAFNSDSKVTVPEDPVYSEGHEVYSYQMTELNPSTTTSRNLTALSRTNSATVYATFNSSIRVPSLPPSPALSLTASVKGAERRSETSDDWVDVSDVEEPEIVITRIRKDPVRTSTRSRCRTRRRPSRVASVRKANLAHHIANVGRDLVHAKSKSKKTVQHQLLRLTRNSSGSNAGQTSMVLMSPHDMLKRHHSSISYHGPAGKTLVPFSSPVLASLVSPPRRVPPGPVSDSVTSINSVTVRRRHSQPDMRNVRPPSEPLQYINDPVLTVHPSAAVSVTSPSSIMLGYNNDETETAPVSSSGDSGFCSRPYGSVNQPLVYENAKLFSVFHDSEYKESQELTCWMEGESDDDTLSEPLYEVINPGANQIMDDDFLDDESFDSDELFDSGEEYEEKRDVSRDRLGSYSGSDRSKGGEDPSKPSIVKIAGAHMKRLRRNWSTTKTDFGISLSKMKKRSTTSVTELNETLKGAKEPKNQRTKGAKEPSGFKYQVPLDAKKTASTWSIKAPFRRKSVPSPSPRPSSLKKESSTFYLTLAMDADQPQPSLDAASLSGGSQVETCPASPISVPPRPKRTSSMLVNTSSPVRPKTAPPAPPKVTAKPPTPPVNDSTQKRRLTRLSHTHSAGELLPPLSLPPLPREIGVALSPDTPTSLRFELLSRVTSLESPFSRLSVASNASRVSSEAYMNVGDVASTPNAKMPNVQEGPHEEGICYLDVKFGNDELYTSSHFADEPLYQFYAASVVERAVAQSEQAYSSGDDDYEVIGSHRNKAEEPQPNRRPTAMELVTPANGRRTLWCELPEVINSGILDEISSQQRKIQEAMFEVITSEASYLRSLNVLATHFIQCPEFANEDSPVSVLTKRQRRLLFSDIVPVRECSERLLADLERRWQESVVISEICDILLEHANHYFSVYVRYCSNQLYQDRILRELKETSPQFLEVLKRLESSPVCQLLAMHSFLMLPMQRITRLPLLVDAIFRRLEFGTPIYETCKETLATLNKIVQECNEGARKMERMEEMLIISRQLDFKDVKAIPLMSASRWLVKKGEMQRLSWREAEGKLTFGRKVHKQTVYVFLFTDLLVVAKRKSDDCYTVLDYCPRNMVQFTEHDKSDLFPGKGFSDTLKNLILLTMLQNHEKRTVEMVLSCPLESDRTRWLEAVTPRISENPDERIYEEWDCPQVRVVHPYVATQHDELSLEITDVVNVLRKMTDGWYEGERLRDGERGWFPGNYTVEIASAHVRARNLRQRYRLLAFSGNFLAKQLQRDKEDHGSDKKLVAINYT